MPQEKDRQDEEMDQLNSKNDGMDNYAGQSVSSNNRMGVRIGGRIGGLGAIQNQDPDTIDVDGIQAPDDIEDDDPQKDDNKIGREPEREPSKDPNLIEERKLQGDGSSPDGDPFGEN